MEQVTDKNWNHCGRKSRQLRAFIGMGALPSEEGPRLLYSIIVSDEEFCEIHQRDCDSLVEALEILNHRYGEWDFYDLQREGGGGCGSCSAH